MKVCILLVEGMRGFDVCAALEVFGGNRSDRGVPLNDVVLVSPSDEPELEGGMRIRALPLEGADGADLLIVPGFFDPTGAFSPSVIRFVLRSHEAGAQIASLCTGAFLLAATGLLDDVEATTHWRFCEELQRRHKRVRVNPKVLYTHDSQRRLWTSAGVSAGIDACLAVLAEVQGASVAAAVARSMVLPAVRSGGQAQFIPPMRGASDGVRSDGDELRAAILRDLAAPWTAQTMAERVHASPRTVHRKFLAETGSSPIKWLISRRVAAAQELLETTELGIEQIAVRVGFGNAVSLRKHFVALLGVPPSEYRRAFPPMGDRRKAT